MVLLICRGADCELCRAVRAVSRVHTHGAGDRLRRQAEFDNAQRVVTKDVVHDVIDEMTYE